MSYDNNMSKRLKRKIKSEELSCIDDIIWIGEKVNNMKLIPRTYGKRMIRRHYQRLQENKEVLTNLTSQLEYKNCAYQKTLEFEKNPTVIDYLLSYIS